MPRFSRSLKPGNLVLVKWRDAYSGMAASLPAGGKATCWKWSIGVVVRPANGELLLAHERTTFCGEPAEDHYDWSSIPLGMVRKVTVLAEGCEDWLPTKEG